MAEDRRSLEEITLCVVGGVRCGILLDEEVGRSGGIFFDLDLVVIVMT